MKIIHLVAGIAGGLAAGAIIGILFAPDKGCNTREKIAGKGNDLKDGIKDSIDGLISSAEKKYEQFASKVGSIKNDVKQQEHNKI